MKSEAGGFPGRARGGDPGGLSVAAGTSPTGAVEQPAGAAESGDQAADAGDPRLPQRGRVPTADLRPGDGNEPGMDGEGVPEEDATTVSEEEMVQLTKEMRIHRTFRA